MIATSESEASSPTSPRQRSREIVEPDELHASESDELHAREPDEYRSSGHSYVLRRARRLARYATPVLAIMLLVASMGGRWRVASASPKPLVTSSTSRASKSSKTPSANASSPKTSSSIDAPSGSSADAAEQQRPVKKPASDLIGKLNLNTATEDELMLLPTVGPAKAERIVTWRKKNGGFRRIADIRRVKGFGYKTFKRLEPFLDVAGATTLH
jgi:competence ComEA-like helix-hairpin-helix protein